MSALATTPTALDYALHYAARGWRVVPTMPGGKVPVMQAWQREGTTDTDRITHWWTKAPDNSISIVTGQASGIWVLDVDISNGKRGDDTLADLEATHGKLPDTWTVVTGSGGLHLYFAWPRDGRVIRNSASGVLGPGLDVRGEGGQVVAPPSVHHTGARYEREASSVTEVADAPGWLIDLLTAEPTPSARAAHPAQGDRPGDLWAAQTTWDDLLTPDGWTLHHTDRDGEQHWTRPGKDRREGTSATVGYKGSDVLKVFTSSVPWLQADATYTKLGYLAARDFDGDHSAAARHLAGAGYRPPTIGDIIGKLPDGATLDEPWGTPEPLITQHEAPAFPIEALPAWAVDHIEAVAKAVQVPVDAPATFAIGALSAVATGRMTVEVDPTHTEPVNLYLALIMRSGTGKSPVEKLTATWARRWVHRKVEEAKPAHDKAMMHARALRKQADAAEKSAELGSISIDEAFDKSVAAEAAERDVDPLPYLFIDDATPEAVTMNLKAFNERQAVIATEADLFDMVTGDSKRRPNINVYLKAWSGDPLTRHRKGGDAGPEATELEHPLMSICCAVQPVVLERIARDPELVRRGFVPRFMVSVPGDRIGLRDHGVGLRSGRITTQAAYDSHAEAVADAWFTYDRPARLRLSYDAAKMYVDWLNTIEPDLADGGEYEALAEWFSKLAGSIPRYAALLWMAEGNEAMVDIDAATMSRALALGAYWLGHAHAAYSGTLDTVGNQAVAILEAIAEMGADQVTVNDIQRKCRRPAIGLDKVRDYVPALRRLVDNGWLRCGEGDGWHTRIGAGVKSPTLDVWTGMHEMTWKANVARTARSAYIGDALFSLPIDTPPQPYPTRYAPHAPERNAPLDAEPVDNSASSWQPGDDPFAPISAAEVAAYDMTTAEPGSAEE